MLKRVYVGMKPVIIQFEGTIPEFPWRVRRNTKKTSVAMGDRCDRFQDLPIAKLYQLSCGCLVNEIITNTGNQYGYNHLPRNNTKYEDFFFFKWALAEI